MIETFRSIWRFAGEEQSNVRRSVIACFFNAVFHMLEIAAIYYTILALLDGKTGPATAWQALGLLAVSILGSAVTRYFSQLQQTHAGYFMAANKRVAIGQRMKSVPMGYFNDNSLGELTGVCMSVVKSFNLTGRGDRTLQEALEYNCRSNLNIEKMFTPYIMAQGIALQLGSVAMMLSAVWFYLSGTMILANALMVVWPMLMRRMPCLSWQRPVGSARPGITALPSTMFRSLMTSGPSCGMYPSPSRTEPPPPSWAPAAPGKPHCVISSPGSGMWRVAPSWWAVRM